jgi:RHH-type proline utilization regulon transcriptional repressor/proline dehydrogenase/delta 1-pyrroline-5-carboxylate dehydrogenase
MTAATLADAIEMQNATDYGLTAGIHSLDADEVSDWLESVDAGNLYVNRGITGAIVRRQPFGGWKRSSVGTGAKAGGPNYIFTLGRWEAVVAPQTETLSLDGLGFSVTRIIALAQEGISFEEFDRVRLAALSDATAWGSEFGDAKDVSGLGVERNVFRYRPTPLTLRLSDGAPLGDLIRLIAAGALTRSPLSISTPIPLPVGLVESFDAFGSPARVDSVVVETDAAWLARVAAGELTTDRIRLIGGDPLALAVASGGHPDMAIWAGPVTTAGRIELLPFLYEQAVSITAHRFGNPDRAMAELPV